MGSNGHTLGIPSCRLDSGVNIDEASQLLKQMETNELEYKKFSDWLGEEKAVMEELKLSCSKWR